MRARHFAFLSAVLFCGFGGQAAAHVTANPSEGAAGGYFRMALRDEFGLGMKLPSEPGTLYFPTVQECEKGESRWVEIPATGQRWGALKAPAPFVRIAESRSAAIPPALTIVDAWARASAGRIRSGAAYLTIANTKVEPDRLLSVATPAAARAELHATVKDGEIMRMRPVGAIAVEPGSRIELRPGGLHLMLLDLTKPLVEGERFPLTLTFEKAGAITTEIVVRGPGATSGGASEHHHHGSTP